MVWLHNIASHRTRVSRRFEAIAECSLGPSTLLQHYTVECSLGPGTLLQHYTVGAY